MSEDRKLAIANALGLVDEARQSVQSQTGHFGLTEDNCFLELDAAILSLGLGQDVSLDFEIPWTRGRMLGRLNVIEMRLKNADSIPKNPIEIATSCLGQAKEHAAEHQRAAKKGVQSHTFFFALKVCLFVVAWPLVLLLLFNGIEHYVSWNEFWRGRERSDAETRFHNKGRLIQLVVLSSFAPVLFWVGLVAPSGIGPFVGIEFSQIVIMCGGIEFLMLAVLGISAQNYYGYWVSVGRATLVNEVETLVQECGIDCGPALDPTVEHTADAVARRLVRIEIALIEKR